MTKPRDTKRFEVEDFPVFKRLTRIGKQKGEQRGSRGVVIPHKWIVEMDLRKRGAAVYVECFEEDCHFLTLSPSKLGLEPMVKGDIIFRLDLPSDFPKVADLERVCKKIERKILAAYLIGYQRIRLKNRSGAYPDGLISRIHYFCQRKLRFANVSEKTANEIIIHAGSPPDFLVKERVAELQKNTLKLHKDLQNLVKRFNDSQARLTIKSDDKVDMICHEVVRLCKLAAQNPLLVKRMGLENYRYLIGCRIIAKRIERCADLACYAILEMLRLHEKEKKVEFDSITQNAILNYSDKVLEVFNKAIDSLSTLEKNMRYEVADELIEQIDSIIGSLEETAIHTRVKSETPEEFYCRRRILDALKRTGEYVKTILEVVENMYIPFIAEKTKTT